ncbi:branched-chain amino acid ABC transporter permease [Baekduia soli]|uniref:Branched-chain amino acid ABC transporter permease n=1 Tax=Baekduia soli TaxID=496014 RepID=A0A5B8U8J5_9ACTN|nr:branched-chain amino acid ABC transporter permease [Baekduia soli]QEC49277.1 branched-chain amino acid ABC transporter permease [Baekduia soli]
MILASLTGFFQYAVDGLINGSSYGLLGLSFGLIVAVTGRFHFAWAAAYALVGFFTPWLVNHTGLPVVLAIIIAMAGAALFNCLLETLIYRNVERRAASQALLAIFVASFGVTIAVPNLVSWIVGPESSGGETLAWISNSPLHIGKVTFTKLDLIGVIAVWTCGVAIWALLKYTPVGRRIRAVQVNPGMAEAVGIDSNRTYLVVFVISALLGGVTAIIASMRSTGTPNMGLQPVFYAFVVAFAAGLGRSPLRIMAIGTAIGILEGISAQVLNVQWQQVVVFAVLLIYLVFKAARAWRPHLFQLKRPATTPAAVSAGEA